MNQIKIGSKLSIHVIKDFDPSACEMPRRHAYIAGIIYLACTLDARSCDAIFTFIHLCTFTPPRSPPRGQGQRDGFDHHQLKVRGC